VNSIFLVFEVFLNPVGITVNRVGRKAALTFVPLMCNPTQCLIEANIPNGNGSNRFCTGEVHASIPEWRLPSCALGRRENFLRYEVFPERVTNCQVLLGR